MFHQQNIWTTYVLKQTAVSKVDMILLINIESRVKNKMNFSVLWYVKIQFYS